MMLIGSFGLIYKPSNNMPHVCDHFRDRMLMSMHPEHRSTHAIRRARRLLLRELAKSSKKFYRREYLMQMAGNGSWDHS